MQPDQQIEQFKELLGIVNKGNATKDEVVELFGVFEKALKKIRADLEKKIEETGSKTDNSHKEVVVFLKSAESRLSDSVKKTEVASKQSVEALKNEFRGQLEAVRKAIPNIPDFERMLEDFRSEIPTIPEFPKPIEYTAGRNIEIVDREITNTNPKITVSREKPSNPQVGDLWVRT